MLKKGENVNTLTWLHMSGCPYCRIADEVFEELKSESPEFAAAVYL